MEVKRSHRKKHSEKNINTKRSTRSRCGCLMVDLIDKIILLYFLMIWYCIILIIISAGNCSRSSLYLTESTKWTEEVSGGEDSYGDVYN